jgi:hypothetical protein
VPFRDIADPTERNTLTAALDEYCRDNRIEQGSQEYEDARRLLVMLFERHGHRTVGALKAALVAAIEREH